MQQLDERRLKKLKLGEKLETASLFLAAAGFAFFAIAYPLAKKFGIYPLELASLIASPVIIAVFATAAAVLYYKCTLKLDKLLTLRILAAFIDNAPAMHPERDTLSFFITDDGDSFSISANGYKDKVELDFTPFGKLSKIRRASLLTEIEKRLIITFCRLYERGGTYKEVNYKVIKRGAKDIGAFAVISNGVPDKKAFKLYLKNK